MKRNHYLLLLPLLLWLTSCSEYKPKTLNPDVSYDDVYLIMGQSNASGVASHAFLEESNLELYQRYKEGNPKVLISYDVDERIETNYVPTRFGFGHSEEFFGPEIGIAKTLNQKEGTSYLIKASWSGSCLQTEYIDRFGQKLKFYQRFIAFIKQQLTALETQGKHPRVRGLFWMQGESDSCLSNPRTYFEAEQQFFESLRIDINQWIYEYFNFVDAYISTSSPSWIDPKTINDCKQRLADENKHCYCIKTNGEDESALKLHLKSESGEDDDVAHYDSKSMLLLGKTVGQCLIK